MKELEAELWEYQGYLNEIKNQLKPEVVVAKPAPLVRYEQSKDLNIPYVYGGIQDQPYLWMLEHGVVLAYLNIQKEIDKAAAQVPLPSGEPYAQQPIPTNW